MNAIIQSSTALGTERCLACDLTLTLALCWQKLGLASNFGHLFTLVCQRWTLIIKTVGVNFAPKKKKKKEGKKKKKNGRINMVAAFVDFRSCLW